jgi:hypothetical protein
MRAFAEPPERYNHVQPTIGMLAGFQVYGRVMMYSFIDSVMSGIRAAARARLQPDICLRHESGGASREPARLASSLS